jgi:ABC-type Fe3+-hydroxamate transport system substrate-binding protein
MLRPIALLAFCFLFALVGCASNQAAPAPAAQATPDEIARQFVAALGSWDEPTLRRIAVGGDATEMRLSSQGGQWRGWTSDRLGAQTDVEITESTVEEDRAALVVRSLHEKGEAGVRLSMVQMDGTWRVEAWDSYRP